MDNSNNFGKTILKLTLFTSIIIWSCVFYDGFYFDMIGYMILLMIPIAIFWSFAVVFTIMPFFWFLEDDKNKNKVFSHYFPYYSIVLFLFFFIISYSLNFYKIGLILFGAIFFGLMFAWIWLSKPDTIKDKEQEKK